MKNLELCTQNLCTNKKRVPQHPYIKTKRTLSSQIVLFSIAFISGDDPFFQCSCKLQGIFICRIKCQYPVKIFQ